MSMRQLTLWKRYIFGEMPRKDGTSDTIVAYLLAGLIVVWLLAYAIRCPSLDRTVVIHVARHGARVLVNEILNRSIDFSENYFNLRRYL